MEDAASRSELGCIVRKWLDREPTESFPKAQHENYVFSKYKNCLESLFIDAQRLAHERGLQADEFEYNCIHNIENFMQDWLAALYDWDKFDPRLWWHRKDPVSDAKSGIGPEFAKAEVECLGGSYLALPVRSKIVDRTLIDCMIAMEYYAFCREVYDPKYAGRVGFIKGNGPGGFMLWRLASLMTCIVVSAPFIFLNYIEFISDGFLMAVGFILSGLWVLESIWATIRLPLAWRAQHRANEKLGKILSQMSYIYGQLESSGPISAAYFRECLVKSSDEGVAWPSPVYAIIDDIIKRDGHF